jgi:integral membrane protein
VNGLSGAFTRYRVMAWVTGVVLASLTVWLVVGYGFLDYANTESKPELYRLLWMAHGWLYVIYLVVGVDLAFRVRYSVPKTLGILVAGTVPFASFFAEAAVHKDLVKRELIAPAARRGADGIASGQ